MVKYDGQTFDLEQGVVTVGSHPKLADWVLDDVTVSREHIRLRREGDQIMLTDLASLNGTSVNHNPVQTCLLSDGDEIRMGNTVVVFKCVLPRVGQ